MRNLPISNHHVTVLLANYALLKPEKMKVDLKYVIQNVCECIIRMVNGRNIKLVPMSKYIN